MRFWISVFCAIGTLCCLFSLATGASAPSKSWVVSDDDHNPCIRMDSQISLNLSNPNNASESAIVVVPKGATVSHSSTCNFNITYNGDVIGAKWLQLDFGAEYIGWTVDFFFTQDKQYGGSGSEFVLFRVGVTANFTATPTLFHTPVTGEQKYEQPLDDTDPYPIFENIYANTHYSYFCSSAQTFTISHDRPKATVTLKKIRVQAYMPSGNTKFGDREVCPQDQTGDDLVPVIVGSCLAALVLITLVIYLIYRARQPPSVLYLTNPHSHFEDIGAFKPHNNHNGHHSRPGSHEEEGEDGDEDEAESQSSKRRRNHFDKPIARHLEQHYNPAFEEE